MDKTLIIKIISISFLIIIGYAGLYDWKTRLVKPWTCIVSYILALSIAILNKVSFKDIIFNSLWLAMFLYVASYLIIKITKREDDVGGGDILIAPAITLFLYNGTFLMTILPLYIGFFIALIDGFIFKRTKNDDQTPMVTYFFIACIISFIWF